MSKKIVTIGIAVVLACVVFVGVCANLSFVNAETLSDEAYTSSDHLLNANGTTETKTIQNFAEEVKAAANNDEVSDLEKVIPTKYLNSSTDITVNYCGAEYGYYFELDKRHHEDRSSKNGRRYSGIRIVHLRGVFAACTRVAAGIRSV